MTSRKHIQNSLNEFCYKVNRRYFGDKLSDRLLLATVTDTRKQLRITIRDSFKITFKLTGS